MTAREKRLATSLVVITIVAITFVNVNGALSKRSEADELQRRCYQAAPLASRLAATIAEKERLLAEARAVKAPADAAVPDAYALGEAVGRVLRSSGATVKGFTIVAEGKKSAVRYSARSDASSLARFLELVEDETPRIDVTALSLGSGNDGWLELSVKAEYGTND